MDRELFARLQAEPNANMSTLEIEHERAERERQRLLQNIKAKATPEQRAEAKRRFDAINAVNRVQKAVEASDIIEVRMVEIQEMILATLKDVTSAEESAEILRRAEPLLKRFATTLSDYDVTNWVGHQIEALRAEKAAKQLAGY